MIKHSYTRVLNTTYLHIIFQICANGLVKFRESSYELSPRNFGTYDGQETGEACLAPYWSFVDLDYFDSGHSKVFYRKYDDPNSDYRDVFAKATDYGNKILNISNYSPSWVMVITWLNLRPKEGSATYEGVSILTYLSCLSVYIS